MNEEERKFWELGMRVYLALGLPRATPLMVAMREVDKAMGGNLLGPPDSSRSADD